MTATTGRAIQRHAVRPGCSSVAAGCAATNRCASRGSATARSSSAADRGCRIRASHRPIRRARRSRVHANRPGPKLGRKDVAAIADAAEQQLNGSALGDVDDDVDGDRRHVRLKQSALNRVTPRCRDLAKYLLARASYDTIHRQHVLSGTSEGSRTDDDRTPAGTAIDARRIGSATLAVRHRL
jgi:hypothetical protein